MNAYRLFQPDRLLATMLVASLAVHALVLLVFMLGRVGFLAPAAQEELVELVLVDDDALTLVELPPEAVDDGMPRQITLMPERLAGEEPEQPDYLADVMSEAADMIPGGEANSQPGARRSSDVQAVQIREEKLDSGPEVAVAEPVLTPPPATTRPEPEVAQDDPVLETDASEHGDDPLTDPVEATDPAEEAAEAVDQPSDYESWVSEQRVPSLLDQGDRGFEFDQVETGDIEANVDIVGGYRLNTYEWNFAPWIRRFANDLQRAWIPPYAYRLGLIDGRTEVRVVVERDGRPSRMDVISREGHESLHTASLAALQACAPYLPLPSDFPKEKLVIVFTLIYPEWRR